MSTVLAAAQAASDGSPWPYVVLAMAFLVFFGFIAWLNRD